MQLVSEFLEQFKECLLSRNPDQLMSLCMPDDMTGWGLYEQEDYNSPDDLQSRFRLRENSTKPRAGSRAGSSVESSTIELEPLDVFGNGGAVAVICQMQQQILFKNGQKLNDSDLRISLYLTYHEGSLKIRHGHLSRVWPMNKPFPESPVPERSGFDGPELSVRLNEAESGPFMELLDKRSAYTESANLEGMLGLQHNNNSNVYWQLQGSPLRGNEQYRKHLLFLKERFHEPLLKYRQPVIFRNQALACLSSYADATYLYNGKRRLISPLRITYILQEVEGQWLCRHHHWSLPCPEEPVHPK